MKNTFSIIAAAVLMTGIVLTGCLSSSNKGENSQPQVQETSANAGEAAQELGQAVKDSIRQFKKDAQETIEKYEKSIAEFKVRIANEVKVNKAVYEEKLGQLEKKNSEMKKKLADYKEEGKDKWESFKNGFTRNMDDIGSSISNFFSTTKER
jgi:hypothetical protein